MIGFLEGPDLWIVLAVILLVFGGSKIPQLARSLGEAQREFRRAAESDGSAGTKDQSAPSDGEGDASLPGDEKGR